MVSTLTFVHSQCEEWTLGMNIHASDNHNLGWGSELWDSGMGYGDSETALENDYVDEEFYE